MGTQCANGIGAIALIVGDDNENLAIGTRGVGDLGREAVVEIIPIEIVDCEMPQVPVSI